MAKIPFFGAAAKAFQFFFVQRAGTTDPAVAGFPARHGNTQAMQDRAADPRCDSWRAQPSTPDPLQASINFHPCGPRLAKLAVICNAQW